MRVSNRYSDFYMTVVSEAAAIGHQPSPRTVPTSMGADTKDFVSYFKEFGFDWKWLAWMMIFDF